MPYDPISWLDSRVSKAESSLKELEKFRDKAVTWARVGALIAFGLINMKRGDATDILIALAKALLK